MLWPAFILGLMGSFHCIAMCGPLMLAMPGMGKGDRRRIWLANLLYQLGRIATYGFLGLLFASVGRGVVIAGWQKGFTILVAASLLLMALFSWKLEVFLQRQPSFQRYSMWLQQAIGRQFRRSGLQSYFLVGMLNGLLPCGLVYAAIAGAVTSPSPIEGALFMAVFGAGTLPLLFGLGVSGHLVPLSVRSRLRKLMPLGFLLLAVMLFLRGVNAGLPADFDFWLAMRNPVMCR